ncbi:hypothetical protein A2U01_0066271, partial [Trifolium medium]|nr:hypothetical protein [Trifolium medium]
SIVLAYSSLILEISLAKCRISALDDCMCSPMVCVSCIIIVSKQVA